MNVYDESAYYYCYCNCNLCDGYGWMGSNPPVGCLVDQHQQPEKKETQDKKSDDRKKNSK